MGKGYNPAKRQSIDLHLGDCLELMAKLPKNSVHLVATDPPYFLHGMGEHWDSDRLNHKKNKAGVVGGLPVGMKFDKKQGIKLQIFYKKVALAVKRILCPGGFFLSFSSPRLCHRMTIAIEDSGFEIRDMYAWHYKRGQQKAFTHNHFVRKMKIPKCKQDEIIASMDGRKTPQLKPQFEPIIVAQKPREGTFVNNWQRWQTGLIDVSTVRVNGQKPSTVIEVEKTTKVKYNCHLTVKPVDLMMALIEIFSTKGQIVLDPFAVSGTTLIAASNTGRRGIGYEVNQNYFNIARKRLDENLNIVDNTLDVKTT